MRRHIPQPETAELSTASHELLRDAPDEVSRLVTTWLAKER